MGGQDAAVRVHEGLPGLARELARARLAAHLAHRLHRVGHAAGHAAVAEGQQPAVCVQRQCTTRCEATVAHTTGRLAARCEAGSSSSMASVIVKES